MHSNSVQGLSDLASYFKRRKRDEVQGGITYLAMSANSHTRIRSVLCTVEVLCKYIWCTVYHVNTYCVCTLCSVVFVNIMYCVSTLCCILHMRYFI